MTSLLPSKFTRLIIGFSSTRTINVVAAAEDLHVGEKAGLEQRLDRRVDLVGIEGFARRNLHVGQDGVGLDALVAFDDNRGNSLRIGREPS